MVRDCVRSVPVRCGSGRASASLPTLLAEKTATLGYRLELAPHRNGLRAVPLRVAGRRDGNMPHPSNVLEKRKRRRAITQMDEEYTVVKPWVLWRRRLLIGAIGILFLALAWGVEVVYQTARVNSGPTAWFMVGTPVVGTRVHARPEFVFSFPGYTTERDCNETLNKLPRAYGGPLTSCGRLLLTDAAQMLMH